MAGIDDPRMMEALGQWLRTPEAQRFLGTADAQMLAFAEDAGAGQVDERPGPFNIPDLPFRDQMRPRPSGGMRPQGQGIRQDRRKRIIDMLMMQQMQQQQMQQPQMQQMRRPI